MNMYFSVWIKTIVYFLLKMTFSVCHAHISEEDVLRRLFNSSVYSSAIGPYTITHRPTEVEVDFDIIALGPINELTMDFSMSLYFRQQWYDPRLAFNDFDRPIQTNFRRAADFWVPDLFFPESKTEEIHEVTIPNMYIRILPNGTLIYSQRLSVTIACLMNLRKFPLDKQTCSFRIESYGYTTNDLLLVWSSKRKFSSLLPSANMPDFELTAITAHDCTAELQTGTFPCLYANLELKRQIGFYLTQTYVPTILIVVLSWISFWIDPDAIPARISVGLLTALTITTQSSGDRSQLPRVSYTKSIDVWMSACLVFVFAAYIEYAFVTVLTRRYRKFTNSTLTLNSTTGSVSVIKVSSERDLQDSNNIDVGERRVPSRSFLCRPTMLTNQDFGRLVDKISRYFFPVAFVLFNICYWCYYVDFI